MSDDIMWQLFADTGDPLLWLYYKVSTEIESTAEDEPSPE